MSTNVDATVDEKTKKETKVPSMYKVIFLNDDVTPMDWVMSILVKVFNHSKNQAEAVTMSVHQEGSGVAGVYSHEIAEQKMSEAVGSTRRKGFPLKVLIEEEE